MNNEQKLQVATDALKLALSNDLNNVPGNTNKAMTEHLWLLGYRKLAAPSTEQPTATADGLRAKILALRPTSTLIAHADSYRVGFAKCQELAAELARIAQAAPALGPLVGAGDGNTRVVLGAPYVKPERAATQPAGEAK